MTTAEYRRQYREARKAKGICTFCPQPICPESSALCQVHHDKNKADGRARYKKNHPGSRRNKRRPKQKPGFCILCRLNPGEMKRMKRCKECRGKATSV